MSVIDFEVTCLRWKGWLLNLEMFCM